MMKKFIFILFCVIALLSFTSCTENFRVRKLGGTMRIELPKGERLIMATWKENNSLYYLTEPMDEDYKPKTKTFREDSSWGMVEGNVLFIERR